jgi:iron complex outermembrane receptor protein
VTLNGVSLQTDQNGIASTALPLGKVEVSVSKEGFLPARASLPVDEAREWRIAFELHPQQQREDEVTVFATRTETRLQDLPTRVEVLGPEEIDEKTMMTPGDIVMMLNEMGGLRVQSTSPSLGAAVCAFKECAGATQPSQRWPSPASRAAAWALADSSRGSGQVG